MISWDRLALAGLIINTFSWGECGLVTCSYKMMFLLASDQLSDNDRTKMKVVIIDINFIRLKAKLSPAGFCCLCSGWSECLRTRCRHLLSRGPSWSPPPCGGSRCSPASPSCGPPRCSPASPRRPPCSSSRPSPRGSCLPSSSSCLSSSSSSSCIPCSSSSSSSSLPCPCPGSISRAKGQGGALRLPVRSGWRLLQGQLQCRREQWREGCLRVLLSGASRWGGYKV